MSPPPLANVFAAHLADPVQRAELERRVADCEEVRLRPSESGWVVAVAPLPNGREEPAQVLAAGLVFAEGRDRLIDDAPDRVMASVEMVLDVVSQKPERLARFPGDFGFLHLKGDGATVVRSCGGLVPFYFRRIPGGGVALATRLDLMVRLLDVEHVMDPLVAAISVGGWGLNPDGRTLLRDVSVVPRGCYARVSPDRPTRIGRYWDPRPVQGTRLTASDEHAPRLRHNLLATLDRDLNPAGGNLIGLSGGVDSSSTAALAAGVLGRPCSALSFLPADREARTRDLGYIESLRQSVRLDPSWRIVLDFERWLELIRAPLRYALQIPHPILCAVAELADRQSISVLFGGEAADDMCGSALTLTDWMDHTSLLSLLRTAPAQLPFGRRDPLRWARRRAQRATRRIELPYPTGLVSFVRPEIQEEYAEWRARRRALAVADRRPLLGLALWCEHDGWVAMNWEVASALGIRRSLPFYTREAHELAFECHPGELVGPSTKKLLRAALRDDVPHLNLFRPDKGGGGWGLERPRPLTAELADGLRAVVDDRFYEHPPATTNTVEALGLAHLTEFDRRLSAARGDGGARAKDSPRADTKTHKTPV